MAGDVFMTAVADMRRLQKEFFRTHDPALLRAAKKSESFVDGMIASYETAQQAARQPQLFAGGKK
mgnify:CR=1 FL=1